MFTKQIFVKLMLIIEDCDENNTIIALFYPIIKPDSYEFLI